MVGGQRNQRGQAQPERMGGMPPRASSDQVFLSGPDFDRLPRRETRRLEKIDAEMAAAFDALRDVGPAVSFFGALRTPRGHRDYAHARAVAAAVGRRGFGVITGGGPGLMEAANRGARDAGARSVGLTIALSRPQRTNRFLDVNVGFHHFFVRKVMFVRYASAFVALPGGFGTLDELFEALTLLETDTIRHFPVVLVGSAFWRGLSDWVEHRLVPERTIDTRSVRLLHVLDDPDEVAAVITRHHRRRRSARLPDDSGR
jgi:uncharacterized protein (TIGR00730 family)